MDLPYSLIMCIKAPSLLTIFALLWIQRVKPGHVGVLIMDDKMKILQPGTHFVLRGKIIDVSTLVSPLDIPMVDVITKDGVEMPIESVIFARVGDPIKAIEAGDYWLKTRNVAVSALRRLGEESKASELLFEREESNNMYREMLNPETGKLGIRVEEAILKDVKPKYVDKLKEKLEREKN